MTTIDHRILIPAPPDAVWAYISDISRNPSWQVDCREIIFLTSRREGPGLRWRYAEPSGHECVIAVTAWYNGLGYEYYFVDGVPFRENIGRVRLQEIPEGTVVQWTFTYELGGVLSGVRNALSVSRQIDKNIADSLKTLWQQLKQTVPPQTLEPKSLMRDAPNVEQRSSYQPRHPSAVVQPSETKPPLNAEPPITRDDAQPIRVLDEPPLIDEDTRPNPAAALKTKPTLEEIPPDIEGEPEFLNRLVDLSRFEPPLDSSDTKPRRPVTPEEIFAPPAPTESEPPAASLADLLRLAEPPEVDTPVVEIPSPRPTWIEDSAPPVAEPEAAAPPAKPVMSSDPAKTPVKPMPPVIIRPPEPAAEVELKEVEKPELPAPEAPPAKIETAPSVSNTSAVSIWEIFGVPRPSESQEMKAVQVEPTEPAVETQTTIEVASPEKVKFPRASSHIGLRIALRRKLVHLRRP
jgi:uncharacterized membrane protein